MARKPDPIVNALADLLGISKDYSRKLIAGTAKVTEPMKQTAKGEFGGHLERLVSKYGLLADATPYIIADEISLAHDHKVGLVELARLLSLMETPR